MLKFFVSALAVVGSVAEPQHEPAFTLRDARQMARPLDHGKPKPGPGVGPAYGAGPAASHGSGDMPMVDPNELENMRKNLHGDPRPERPPPPPAPGMLQSHEDLGIVPPHGDPRPERPAPPAPGMIQKSKPAPESMTKRIPLVPGQHSRPGFNRGLHGDFRRGSSDDHHHDDHHFDHDEHHDDHRMSQPGRMGKPSPAHQTDEEDWIFPYVGMPPPAGSKPKPSPAFFKPKPSPGVFVGNAKPKPKPKAKPTPGHSLGTARSQVEQLSSVAQQQCEMDYVRMCSPQTSFLSSTNSMSRPFSMSPQNSRDSFMVDAFIIDVPQGMPPRKTPCGTRPTVVGDDDGDDDYTDDDDAQNDEDDYYYSDDDDDYDDDADDISSPGEWMVVDFPPFDVVQGFLSSLLGLQSRDAMSSMPPTRVLRANEELDLVLGFGQDGDMCLLNNFPLLSNGCQQSVAELQEATDAFDMEEGNGCHMMPVIMVVLFVVLMVRGMRARRMKQRLDSFQTTLAAIHASPDLKAKVEAASGVPLPPTLPKCRMAEKPWYVKALCVVGMFVVSFIIVANAFLITGLIVSQFIATDNNDEVSPFLVLSILFAVLTLEIIAVKKLKSAVCAYLDSSNAPATASSGTTTPRSGNNGGGASLPQIFQRIRTVQISSLLPARFRPASPSEGAQYVPLLSEENCCQDDCTEMSSMRASAPPASAVSTIPVVITPVSYASPSVQSSISMF
jgi:hypothetical protein